MLFANDSRRDRTQLQHSLDREIRTQSMSTNEDGYGLDFEPVNASDAMLFAAGKGGTFRAALGVERSA